MRTLTPLLLLVGVALSARAQNAPEVVHPLPVPTGPRAVGTTVAYLVDSTRTDADFPTGRPITLQLWYPAERATGVRAAYLLEPQLGSTLRRIGYYGVDSAALKTWESLRTHAWTNAPPLPGRHALVTLSVGLGVVRANYTSIATQLASRGYIVAMVESPLAGLMVLPNGQTVMDTTNRLEAAAGHRAAVAAWSRDVSFVLNELSSQRAPANIHRVAATIDWSRVGAIGHSSGGLVAIATCETDVRVRACANMDGGLATPQQEPIADFVAKGVTKPTLVMRSHPIYSDSDFARRGLTREAWEKRNAAGSIAFDAFAVRSTGPVWVARVAGTGHFTFSDAPYVMPSAISRFGGKIIAADRGLDVITTVLLAFFDQQLAARPADVGDLGLHLSEVTITRSNR